jgi:hypothetical protein
MAMTEGDIQEETGPRERPADEVDQSDGAVARVVNDWRVGVGLGAAMCLIAGINDFAPVEILTLPSWVFLAIGIGCIWLGLVRRHGRMQFP